MDYLRLTFWILACIFMIPLILAAWIVLFWVRPGDEDFDDEDPTLEYDV
jgi:phage shock protein PspC (stress-responsive transcriptional regulator)